MLGLYLDFLHFELSPDSIDVVQNIFVYIYFIPIAKQAQGRTGQGR